MISGNHNTSPLCKPIHYRLRMTTWEEGLSNTFSAVISHLHRKKLTRTDASTILNPVVPLTRKSGSTTPQLAFLGDIEAVPAPCKKERTPFLKKSSKSWSDVTFSGGMTDPKTDPSNAGAENNLRAVRQPSRKIDTSASSVRKRTSMEGYMNGSGFCIVTEPPMHYKRLEYMTDIQTLTGNGMKDSDVHL